jgi:hypothetical protein
VTQVHAARERGSYFADQSAKLLSRPTEISKASVLVPMRGALKKEVQPRRVPSRSVFGSVPQQRDRIVFNTGSEFMLLGF